MRDDDVLAGDALEHILELLLLARGQRMRRRDVRGDLAPPLGGNAAVSPDHRGDREQPAVPGDDAQEVADQAANSGTVGDRRDGAVLIVGRKHRASDQSLQIGAPGGQLLEAAEVAFHRSDGIGFAGKLEQRTRITFGKA